MLWDSLYILDKMDKIKDAINRYWYIHTFCWNYVGNDIELCDKHLDYIAGLILEFRMELNDIKDYWDDIFLPNPDEFLCNSIRVLFVIQEHFENLWYKFKWSILWDKPIIKRKRKILFDKIEEIKKDFLKIQ